MKTTAYRKWSVVGLCALTAITVMRASAEQAATAAKHEKTYTGTVVSVDPQDHQLKVKGWFLSKEFNLGDNCAYALLDQSADMVNGLRPGQKVTVSYQDASGVLVADRVKQEPLRYEGMVKTIDPVTHKLTVHHRGMDKTFEIAGECKVMLRDDRTGELADVQPGNHVTVIYEIPKDTPTARRIDQTSATYTGTLTAIDLTDRTIKAKHMFGSKKFNLADGCAIVLNGKTNGQMGDLKPGDSLTFSYNDVNGVNIVNRIARAETPEETPTSVTSINHQ